MGFGKDSSSKYGCDIIVRFFWDPSTPLIQPLLQVPSVAVSLYTRKYYPLILLKFNIFSPFPFSALSTSPPSPLPPPPPPPPPPQQMRTWRRMIWKRQTREWVHLFVPHPLVVSHLSLTTATQQSSRFQEIPGTVNSFPPSK